MPEEFKLLGRLIHLIILSIVLLPFSAFSIDIKIELAFRWQDLVDDAKRLQRKD